MIAAALSPSEDKVATEGTTSTAVPTTTTTPKPRATAGQEQALGAAQDYFDSGQHFSRHGLIDQLDSPYGGKFTKPQAEYGANAVGL